MSGRSFWTNMTFETWASMTGAVCMFIQLVIEPALWWDWPPWEISRNLFGWTALSFLLLAPVSGLLGEHYFVRRTPPGTTLPFPLRTVLFLVGCVPWLGLLAIPIWRRLLVRAPDWAFRPTASRLDLDAPDTRLPRRSPLHPVYASGAFGFWMIVMGLLLPLAGSLWLAAGRNRGTILGACIALHLAQAACMALHAESELRFTAQPRRTLRLIPWLCLLPQPVSTFAMALSFWPVLEGARGKTLTWSAYARRVGVGRHSQWLDLRLALQQRWEASSWIERWTTPRGLELPQREGRVEEARRTWMRTKSYLLVIETALVAGLIVRLTGARSAPAYDPVADPALRPWLIAVSLLAALGLLQAGLGALCLLLRVSHLPRALDPPAAGLYLFITQAALAVGLLTGALAAHGNLRVLAALSFAACTLAALLTVLIAGLILLGAKSSQSEPLGTLLIWLAALVSLGSLPLVAFKWPNLAWAGVALAMLAPVVDVLVGVRCLGWILYPFGWRDIFEKQLGARIRLRLGLMALMALLPLGGIAVPVWVWTSLPLERHADAG